jgi:hypothetical protein
MEEYIELEKVILYYEHFQMRAENSNFLEATEPCFQVPTHYFMDSIVITAQENHV